VKFIGRVAAIAGAAVIMGGCTTYYQVREPSGGRAYYTTGIDSIREGAVKFRDDKSGSTVTLQNSEIREIPKDEYQQGLNSPAAPPAVRTPGPLPAAPPVSR
jgi:hypothetical protein